MPRAGYVNLSIKPEIYKQLYTIYEKKRKGSITFTSWLLDIVYEHLEEDELLNRYTPGLELIGVEYNTAFVKDWFIDRIVEVTIHDQGIGKRFLYCRHCERDDCLHVGFCFAVREINKVLVERGFKQPKVRKDG
jgi:hypothetical protein